LRKKEDIDIFSGIRPTSRKVYPSCDFSPDSKFVVMKGLWHQIPGSTLPGWFPLQRRQPTAGYVVRLWNAETGEEIASFEDCRETMFSPDSKTLATAHGDGTIRLWDIPPRRPIWLIIGVSTMLWGVMLTCVKLFSVGLRKVRGSGHTLRVQ
jgi:hypothetical protein